METPDILLIYRFIGEKEDNYFHLPFETPETLETPEANVTKESDLQS